MSSIIMSDAEITDHTVLAGSIYATCGDRSGLDPDSMTDVVSLCDAKSGELVSRWLEDPVTVPDFVHGQEWAFKLNPPTDMSPANVTFSRVLVARINADVDLFRKSYSYDEPSKFLTEIMEVLNRFRVGHHQRNLFMTGYQSAIRQIRNVLEHEVVKDEQYPDWQRKIKEWCDIKVWEVGHDLVSLRCDNI